MAEKAPTFNFGQSKDEKAPTFNLGPIDGPANPSIDLVPPPPGVHPFAELQQKTKDMLLRLLDSIQPDGSYPGYVLMILIQGMLSYITNQETNKLLDDVLEKLKKQQEK